MAKAIRRVTERDMVAAVKGNIATLGVSGPLAEEKWAEFLDRHFGVKTRSLVAAKHNRSRVNPVLVPLIKRGAIVRVKPLEEILGLINVTVEEYRRIFHGGVYFHSGAVFHSDHEKCCGRTFVVDGQFKGRYSSGCIDYIYDARHPHYWDWENEGDCDIDDMDWFSEWLGVVPE